MLTNQLGFWLDLINVWARLCKCMCEFSCRLLTSDRNVSTVTGQDIIPLLKASFPSSLPEGSFPSTGIAFLQAHELLINELLLATPQVTAR